MKTTTITKLDIVMLLICFFPLFTLLNMMNGVTPNGTNHYVISFVNTFCVVIPMVYSVYRMINGYKNIAALFTLFTSLLFSLSICASICGIVSPLFV